MIKISVLIVSYKNLSVLKSCVESIIKFNDIGSYLEIIIIDNSPTDEIYNFFFNYNHFISIIKNPNNGFGEANNVGAKMAKGDILLFLNPDTILTEPIFLFALSKFKNNTNLGMFGLKLVDKNFKTNMSYYFMDKYGFFLGQLIKLFNHLNIFINNKMCISGADMFFRKKAFFDCGMFDENIFLYKEEADITRRLLLNGWQTGFYSEKKIIHLEGKSSESKITAFNQRLESRDYYCNKYGLDHGKIILKEIRFLKIKKFFYTAMFKKRMLKLCIININLLEEFSKKKFLD